MASVPFAPDPPVGVPEACRGGHVEVQPPVHVNFVAVSPSSRYSVNPFESTSTTPSVPTFEVPRVEPEPDAPPPAELVEPPEPAPLPFELPQAAATRASATSETAMTRVFEVISVRSIVCL